MTLSTLVRSKVDLGCFEGGTGVEECVGLQNGD